MGSKYLEYNPGSGLNIYWVNMKLNNEIESKKIISWNKTLHEGQTKDEQ
jgi:hypothetical protein